MVPRFASGSSILRTKVAHPVVLVLIGIASVQVGATFAKSLFDEVTPTAMVWLRLSLSALILLAITRPRVRGFARRDWLVVLAFGASLGLMNWTIYQAFARLPIGIAVTIEFIGPLTIALLSSRRARDLVWVALAAAGVVLLGLEPGPISIPGVLFALAAGACWASYIVLSKATGARWEGIDGLALASTVAAVALTPAAMTHTDGLGAPHVWLVGLMVGLMSSVVPYSLDLIALRSIKPALYAILMSLEPAAGALAAIVVLHEGLSGQQWLAIACVVVASAGATTTGKPAHHVPAESTPA
ncbi:inner membrane transporter RhtA [Nocardioides albertanoniae]|uniref:Inner membrane transporter RhtA n=1 Tax=Nocardioides albertanoniae TaxID=1175486 RepID=A0A543AA97_9ACTN|nr:EamA family transporter [Nocardioides albertanoniae]TQL69527.1 inner membrane transporter RhtA [Nocardioides albertanoniae]